MNGEIEKRVPTPEKGIEKDQEKKQPLEDEQIKEGGVEEGKQKEQSGNSDIEKIIKGKRESRVEEIKKGLEGIKKEVTNLTQESFNIETPSGREKMMKKIRELSVKESEWNSELIKAMGERIKPISEEEITEARLELTKITTGGGKETPKSGLTEKKVDDFINEIRENKELTPDAKKEILRKRLDEIVKEKGSKAGLDPDFQKMRIAFVEILGEQGEVKEAEKPEEKVEPKKSKEAVKTAAGSKETISEAKKEPVTTDKGVVVDKETAREKKAKREDKLTSEQPSAKEEAKTMTSEEMKEKVEKIKTDRKRLEEERKEWEKKRQSLVEYVKKDKEGFEKIWSKIRDANAKSLTISDTLRREEEKIKRISDKKPELFASDLKLDFLRDEKMMSPEKEDILHALNAGSTEVAKTILEELAEKYKKCKERIVEIQKEQDKIPDMGGVYKEVTGKNIFDVVSYDEKAGEISREEFGDLDKTIENIGKIMEEEKVKLFPVEAKEAKKETK